jgi:hypothetical protein
MPPIRRLHIGSLKRETEIHMTKILSVCALIATIFLTPFQASAQGGDSAYCSALSQKYQQFLDAETRGGRQPQSLDARAAIEKCKAGDMTGIPVIEKALKDAKIDLPPRS